MRTSIALLIVSLFVTTIANAADETAADIATRTLLDMLEERQMPDVTLAILERVTAEPTASEALKREVPLRRAGALVGMSKTEGDSKKRAAFLDDAQKALDEFLASGKFTDVQAIAAYSQKGSLLVERGRSKADQANRPGAEAAPLRAEAIKFFDEAIKSLKGVTKPDQEIKAVTNAEDAVLKVLREVSSRVKALKERDVASGGTGKGGDLGSNLKRIQKAAADAARAARAANDEAAAAQAAAAQAGQQAAALKAAADQAAKAKSPQAGNAKKAADQAAAAKTTADTMANMKVAAAKAASEKAAEAKKAATAAMAAEKGGANEKGDGGEGAPPARLTAKEQRQLAALTEEMEALQGKLLQTRMTTAAAVFEKARAYPEKSKEWTDTITASAALFKDLAEKYPTKGAGLLAQYYEGRNYALLQKWDQTFDALAQLVAIQEKIPLAILIRSRSLNTFLEAVVATKKYETFDDSMRKFSLEDPKKLPGGGKLDADWLGLKYRAALVLEARGLALDDKDPKNKNERSRLFADAKKLATEVALANADYAKEAREVAARRGKDIQPGDETFEMAWDEAQAAMGMVQQRLAEEKQAVATKDPEKIEAAKKATAEARTPAIAGIEKAMKLAGLESPLSADSSSDDKLVEEATIDQISQARYLLTFLLYSAERYEESAGIARLLTEKYPRARGSRQAATIGLSALQQLAQRAADEETRQAARTALSELATAVMRVWPTESGDAASILIANAIAARNPHDIVAIMDSMPADSPYIRDVSLRGGAALWREVMEARRNNAGNDPAKLEAWKARARKALDDGLAVVASAGTAPEGPGAGLAVAGALARVQIAMDDGDTAAALATLNHAVYGPWPLWAAKNPALQQGTLSEATLTLALRLFIQSEKFEEAQEAMDGLEKLAGAGEEAAAKLTAMYFSMSRDLQAQLAQMGANGAKDPQARARAEKILVGFEKFLDRVAARDQKISSQFWVATTFLTLGSGKGIGAVVAKDKASRYLERAAQVYKTLLEKKDDPEVTRFEPSIRLRMADIYQELRQWDEAQKQFDTVLSDPKRQNSLDTQLQAARMLQLAADDAANNDATKADALYREASGGRRKPPVVIWGWRDIAKRLSRQDISGATEKSRLARETFFEAWYRSAECSLARARLPGKESQKKARLDSAETAISMTFKLYPDLGGPDMTGKYDAIAKQIQQEQGKAEAVGLQAYKTEPAAAPTPAPANQQGAAPAAAGGVN